MTEAVSSHVEAEVSPFQQAAVLMHLLDKLQCKRAELLLAQCKPVLMKHLLDHFAKVTFWWTRLLFPRRVVWSHFEIV